MSMTDISADYFDRVAGQWDSLRSGYFTEAVRAAAIRKAYLRPEMIVADVGGGTGFMTAGLAPLVSRVYLFDGSQAMLAEAEKNLREYSNVVFQEADGLSLPLPDGSLDVVFANMYLHHMEEPLVAIREMVRLLRPGGRLVITDMDLHPFAWLKDEMADTWMGFDRDQMRDWLQQADLVNVIVDCTGESCCAESHNDQVKPEERQARISVFVATGTRRIGGVHQAVGSHYGALAAGGSCGCSSAQAENSSCCAESGFVSLEEVQTGSLPGEDSLMAKGYTAEQRSSVPEDSAGFSLGCGNPTALAEIRPGETALDIGSGGGLDAFLAARQVSLSGKVIGIDMSTEMLERARRSAEKAGLSQVEFRQGYAEALPVEDNRVDVVLSNCVINLTEDKGRVFQEAYRVLKEGGRLEVSDVVTDNAFPLDARQSPENWGSCIYGALPEQEYLDLVAQAGFKDIRVRRSPSFESNEGVRVYSAQVSAKKLPAGSECTENC